MSVATIITILSIVNGLISIAKDEPEAADHAKTWLAKVQPHIATAGDDVKQAFAAAQVKVSAL